MKISFIVPFLFTLFLTNYSYSLDYLQIDGEKYELDEVDFGRDIGCSPGQFIAAVIRKSEDQKTVWSSITTKEIREDYFYDGRCVPATLHYKIENLFKRQNEYSVDFVVRHIQCGASCMPQSVSIYRFYGNEVKKIKDITAGRGLELNFYSTNSQIIAIYQIDKNECNACPKNWVKDVYEWNGNTYKKIESTISKDKSNTSPWSESTSGRTSNAKVENSGQSKDKRSNSKSNNDYLRHKDTDLLRETKSLNSANFKIVCDRFYPDKSECIMEQTESLLWTIDLVTESLPDSDNYSGVRFQLCTDRYHFGGKLFDFVGIRNCTTQK